MDDNCTLGVGVGRDSSLEDNCTPQGVGTESLEDLGLPSVAFGKMPEIKSMDPCKQVAGWMGEVAGTGSQPSEV